MKVARIKENQILQPLAEVEKRLMSNMINMDWEVEHTEDLFTEQGHRVRILVGVCGAYSGVHLWSFLSHGGGHVAYYLKLEQLDEEMTQVTAVVTGSEDVGGDFGDRNGHLAELLLQMCHKDCTHKTFQEKLHDFLR